MTTLDLASLVAVTGGAQTCDQATAALKTANDTYKQEKAKASQYEQIMGGFPGTPYSQARGGVAGGLADWLHACVNNPQK